MNHNLKLYHRKNIWFLICCFLNPFVPNATFLYPLERSENLGCIRNEWVMLRFAATGGFLQRCSSKFRKFHIKIPALEGFLVLSRIDSNAGVFLWYLQKFEEHQFWKTSKNFVSLDTLQTFLCNQWKWTLL